MELFLSLDPEYFLEALKSVQDNKTFHLPSVEATRALKLALSLTSWVEGNAEKVKKFEQSLVEMLVKVTTNATYVVAGTQLVNRECLWSTYHALILSANFKRLWTDFLLDSVEAPPCAIL